MLAQQFLPTKELLVAIQYFQPLHLMVVAALVLTHLLVVQMAGLVAVRLVQAVAAQVEPEIRLPLPHLKAIMEEVLQVLFHTPQEAVEVLVPLVLLEQHLQPNLAMVAMEQPHQFPAHR